MIGIQNDSKMIGKVKHPMMMINEVNTMTPRQNDLVVKKPPLFKPILPLELSKSEQR